MVFVLVLVGVESGGTVVKGVSLRMAAIQVLSGLIANAFFFEVLVKKGGRPRQRKRGGQKRGNATWTPELSGRDKEERSSCV